MNYDFKLDDASVNNSGEATIVSGNVFMDENLRPSIGTELRLSTSTKKWTVVRIEPPSNPTGQKNTYFIQETKTLILRDTQITL